MTDSCETEKLIEQTAQRAALLIEQPAQRAAMLIE